MTFILNNRAETTKKQIKEAFEAGKARLVYGYGLNKIETMLALDDEDWDTRGKNQLIDEDTWTKTPEKLSDCLEAAYAGNY